MKKLFFVLVFFLPTAAAFVWAAEPETSGAEGTAERTDAVAADTKTITIPLDEIWALDMPGTRDINELFGPYPDKPHLRTKQALHEKRRWQRLLVSIQKRLAHKKQPDKKAKASFAIVAEGHRNVIALAGEELGRGEPIFGDPSGMVSLRLYRDGNSFFSSSKLRIVFFSYASKYRVELVRVERQGTVIDVCYRFAPHDQVDLKGALALIPVSKLPVGEYHVQFSQLPMEQIYLDTSTIEPVSDEQASRIVCQPFSFQVWDPPSPDPGLGKDAIEIPLDQIWGHRMPGTKNVAELEPNRASLKTKTMTTRERTKKSWVTNTRWLLNRTFKPAGPDVGTAFVVPMIDLDALKEANAIIGGTTRRAELFPAGQRAELIPVGQRAEQLPAGQPLTLVFYSFSCGQGVRLDKVTKSKDEIVLEYHFHIHGNLTSSPSFALIPIGIFPPGNVNVKIKRLPDTEGKNLWGPPQPLDDHRARRIVCAPFVFKVIDTQRERSGG